MYNSRIKKSLESAAPSHLSSSRLSHACVCDVAAFPGEGGVSGAGSGQREAAAGGDAHGQGGSHAQRPPPPGPGELHHRPAGCAPSGRHPFTSLDTADCRRGDMGTEGH